MNHEKQKSRSYVRTNLYFELLVPFWIILLASHVGQRQRVSPAMFCDYQTIAVFGIVSYSSPSNESAQSPKRTSIEGGACGAYHLYIMFMS